MDRGQRTVVAGVHRLQHVQRLAASAFADDDPIRPHPERVDDQVADADSAAAVDPGRPRLEANLVRLPELQLGGVFNGDDPLRVRNESGQDVEGGRLAGAGAAGDEDVEVRLDTRFEEAGRLGGQRPEADQILDREGFAGKLPDRERCPIDRERRNNGIDAGAVGKPAVNHRRVVIDTASHECGDLANDADQIRLARKGHVREGELSFAFDVDLAGTVDHHFADAVFVEQRRYWTVIPRIQASRLGGRFELREVERNSRTHAADNTAARLRLV